MRPFILQGHSHSRYKLANLAFCEIIYSACIYLFSNRNYTAYFKHYHEEIYTVHSGCVLKV